MSNALLIYNQLRASGISEAGALGLMGNWMAESGLEPNRVQGDFSQGRLQSTAYTDDLKKGRLGKAQFARDQKGYGLAQWTYYTRKEALYDFWKNSGADGIDDLRMQVRFALHELSESGEYAGLWSVLKTTEDIWTAADKVCRLYERPYYNNVEARYQYALQLKAELDQVGAAEGSEHSDAREACDDPSLLPDASGKRDVPELDPTQWPPRMVDRNMSGSDVIVLQALLYARGLYHGGFDGHFGDGVDMAVRQFQREQGLDVDGVVGPLTWAKLLSQS